MSRLELRWPYAKCYWPSAPQVPDQIMTLVVLPSVGPTRASTICEMMFEIYQSWVDAPMLPGIETKSVIQKYRWEWDCVLLRNRGRALREVALCSRSAFVGEQGSEDFADYKCESCHWFGWLCNVCFENCHVKQGHTISRISPLEARRLLCDSQALWRCRSRLGHSEKLIDCECLFNRRVPQGLQAHCTLSVECDRLMALSSTGDLSSADATVHVEKGEEILVRFRPTKITPGRSLVVDRTLYHADVIESFVKSYPRGLIPNYIICRWVRTSKCQTLPDFLRSRCCFGMGVRCRAWELGLALQLASRGRDDSLCAMLDGGLNADLVLRSWQGEDRLHLYDQITRKVLQTISRVAGAEILQTRGKSTRYWCEAKTTLLHDLIRIRRAKRHTVVLKADLIAELCRLDPALVSIADETGDLPIDVLFRTTRRERQLFSFSRDGPEYEAILSAFHDAGADPSRVDRHGLSVLQKACRSFAFKCAGRLLDAGAARPASASDLFLRSPVTFDVLSSREHESRVISFLRKLDRGIPYGRELLCYAVNRGCPAGAEFCEFLKGELGDVSDGQTVGDLRRMSFTPQELRFYRRGWACGRFL